MRAILLSMVMVLVCCVGCKPATDTKKKTADKTTTPSTVIKTTDGGSVDK